MTKIRTAEELQDKLDAEMAWRKKELSTIKFLIEGNASKKGKGDCLIRSGITLLYAHWEGFIKEAARYYLEYVLSLKRTYDQLNHNFLALAMKRQLEDPKRSKKAETYNEILNYLLNCGDEVFVVSVEAAIDTKSNLSFEVFKDILCLLGFDFIIYATKAKLIDEQLLYKRNTIAHGKYLLTTEEEFYQVFDSVLNMMQIFLNQISNAAATKQFLK